MSRSDTVYDLAAIAAAEITNLHLHPEPCKRYEAVLKVLLVVLNQAVVEERESVLRPSIN